MRQRPFNMSFMKKFLWIVLIAGMPVIAAAQETLNIDDAVRIGLEKNFSIRIAKNNSEVAGNNNSIGNAGMLPSVNANGAINQRIQDNVTDYSSSIPDRNDEGAKTTVFSYGVDATWTVFDGLTMFATADRLSAQQDISEMQYMMEVEQFLADIVTTYFQIVGQQQAYEVLENTLEISDERIRIAETKKDLGSGSEYDLLQARADYNADRAALIRSGTGLKRSKILVAQILADNEINVDFKVQDNIELQEPLELNSLLNDVYAQNLDLGISRLNETVAEAEIREITGEWFPQIQLGGGYGYNRTEASSGFAEFSETKGFNYGVTARINLFDGLNKKRRRQNAQIELKNEQLRMQQQELLITGQVQQMFAQYEDALSLIELEKENLSYTEKSLDIALERFRLGTINSVELREAQLSLLNAENRLISAQIEAKTAETELLKLSGRLVLMNN